MVRMTPPTLTFSVAAGRAPTVVGVNSTLMVHDELPGGTSLQVEPAASENSAVLPVTVGISTVTRPVALVLTV
jgi:hypothetical protein